ncbi:2-keto-4-pentenoate hydratase [Pusillimonas sp. TS35]|uniref:fumarylacetoacetate hydrolase family protein n=1 Tax=Paracandidimonas lactea TaxID=2895524 RepID=UPI00136DC41E|nr:fumarylacetoacetate hydrolase family protein [Paracandidimonas lactea]MYN12817.1 2-keto-4-pentenoate hydratase [Pusillimonas sp. TS35]
MSSVMRAASPTDTQQVADALIGARREGKVLSAAPYDGVIATAEQAYVVQDVVADALGWFDAGFPGYWKSGGPNRDATLTHASLPPAGVWNSPAEAGVFVFHRRGIEAEVALRLGSDIDQHAAARLDEESAQALIDAMAVSLEIVDSRWQECMAAPALLRLADLQCHGALVLGDWQPWSARDWAQQTCRVQIGAQPITERRGTHPLGTPTWGLPVWLRHATRNGAVVPAGTVVTTGTWVGILDAQAGDRVIVTFDGIGSAEVQL